MTTEEFDLVETIKSNVLTESGAAALIRAYGDRRVESAADDYFQMPLYSHYAAKHLARWRDLCLDKIAKQKARIAELENQLATAKDDCADRAVKWVRGWLGWPLTEKVKTGLRAAIKGE